MVSEAEDAVCYLNAPVSGIFLKGNTHGAMLKAGDRIGSILNPLTGEILCQVTAPADGLLFTIREYPVVDEGSLLARIRKEAV